jgi:hypothetical protein
MRITFAQISRELRAHGRVIWRKVVWQCKLTMQLGSALIIEDFTASPMRLVRTSLWGFGQRTPSELIA